jgi:hypothetical protein
VQATVEAAEERRPAATLAIAVVVALAGFAFISWVALNALVVYPLLDSASACKRSHDLGLGLAEVIDADRTWLPPGVDCVIENRGSSPSTHSRHHFPSEQLTIGVVATDAAAVVVGCVAVGWTRRSRSRRG